MSKAKKTIVKSCPFCGGPAKTRKYPDFGREAWCPECDTGAMPLDDWNQRVVEAERDRLCAALRALRVWWYDEETPGAEWGDLDAIVRTHGIDPEKL